MKTTVHLFYYVEACGQWFFNRVTGWKDQLVYLDATGIRHDEIGNPLTWRLGVNLTWEAGSRFLPCYGVGTPSVAPEIMAFLFF